MRDSFGRCIIYHTPNSPFGYDECGATAPTPILEDLGMEDPDRPWSIDLLDVPPHASTRVIRTPHANPGITLGGGYSTYSYPCSHCGATLGLDTDGMGTVVELDARTWRPHTCRAVAAA